MSNLLARYRNRRYARLFVGPSEMTPRTYSRSTKYSLMVGIVKAGFLSLPKPKDRVSQTGGGGKFRRTGGIVDLEYSRLIEFKIPAVVATRNFALFEQEFLLTCPGLTSMDGLCVGGPVPVWGWRFRVYAPGLVGGPR